MLSPEDKRAVAARVIEKFSFLEGLAANPDFQKWREIGPDKLMQDILEGIKTADTTQDGWKDRVAAAVISYQAVRHSMDVMELNEQSLKIARETIKASETGQG